MVTYAYDETISQTFVSEFVIEHTDPPSQDVLNQWCKDGHVSEKELREMETHGLQMRPLPQNAHDFEYFEESCN